MRLPSTKKPKPHALGHHSEEPEPRSTACQQSRSPTPNVMHDGQEPTRTAFWAFWADPTRTALHVKFGKGETLISEIQALTLPPLQASVPSIPKRGAHD
jgi:hypothetical protein